MLKHRTDYSAKSFTCWGQFVAMLFCQFGHADSLREIWGGGLASFEGEPQLTTLVLSHQRVKALGSNAEATLVNGRSVSLTDLSFFGTDIVCLNPAFDIRPDARLAEVRVAASKPLTVEKAIWISTAK